jgi:aspartyl-tRNA(Asn)/glutamyl-tRNA(Gln) amidotransferase subunit C
VVLTRIPKFKTMPITEADVEKIAQLAHMEITADELKIFAPQMAEIVNYVEQLNEVSTGNVKPALGGLTPEGEATDSARDDVVTQSLGQKTALAEAPDAASGHFRVPKIL